MHRKMCLVLNIFIKKNVSLMHYSKKTGILTKFLLPLGLLSVANMTLPRAGDSGNRLCNYLKILTQP